MRKRRNRGFLLMEVLLAIMIIGIALVALIRGFILSLDSMKRVKNNEMALLLARAKLDDLQIEPPIEGRYQGRFVEDPRFGEAYSGWLWTLNVEEERIRYNEDPRVALRQDMEPVYRAQLIISLQVEGRSGEQIFLSLDTYLLDPTIYTDQAIQANQLF